MAWDLRDGKTNQHPSPPASRTSVTQYAYLVSVLATVVWQYGIIFLLRLLTVNHNMACRKNYEAFSTSASLTACKQITNKTGCHRAGGHGTSARALN